MQAIVTATVDAVSSFNPDDFYVPPGQQAGVYAHAFTVWFTPYDFAIDFAAFTESSEAAAKPQVVSRVRIPAATAFTLIRTMSGVMEEYEKTWGTIRDP